MLPRRSIACRTVSIAADASPFPQWSGRTARCRSVVSSYAAYITSPGPDSSEATMTETAGTS